MKKTNNSYNLNTDLYICAKQLSQELYTSSSIKIGEQLIYNNGEKEFSISLDDNRIVKQPGFQIFVFDVDELFFDIENSFVYMFIKRDDIEYSFLVGSVYDRIE